LYQSTISTSFSFITHLFQSSIHKSIPSFSSSFSSQNNANLSIFIQSSHCDFIQTSFHVITSPSRKVSSHLSFQIFLKHLVGIRCDVESIVNIT